MAEEIVKKLDEEKELDDNKEAKPDPAPATFTQEQVEELIQKKVGEATQPLLAKIQTLNETTFALEMAKANLNLNEAQKEMLKDYADKRSLTDVNSMVDLAKELFGAVPKEKPTLTDEDFAQTFTEIDPNNLRKR
ncbi:hypothetical protein LD119_00707 [Mesoplasma sp. JKS002660]|uniref:hypothetical protein n=1 Tax=Mesoplasma whartonense TaxID=2878854 RepID=UPI002022B4C4|nr:hypothetical protein [Mesoplasma sp. JKS002660]MCL8213756.1 hypothetical protein [Mesoplasma sp. JKS002660]